MNTQLIDYIKKYLPEAVREDATKYDIPVNFIQSMPDLIVLVLGSKSIDTVQEKQSRFSLLPLMNDEQIARLNDILTREKTKLEEIQKKYQQESVEVKKKYLMKKQQINQNIVLQQTKAEEQLASQQDTTQADALLSKIA
ncbi:MAG: hypothetical protein WC004_00255 [Candidatus Absconditabacterales bacterium]